MVESYILEKADELNEIEKLGDEFYIFILKNGWIKFFITPSSIFKDSYNVYDNRNDLIDCYDSIVDAVQHIFKIL